MTIVMALTNVFHAATCVVPILSDPCLLLSDTRPTSTKGQGRPSHPSVQLKTLLFARPPYRKMYPLSFTLSLLLLPLLCSLSPSHGAPPEQHSNYSTKYLEITHALPTDYQVPTCSLFAFQLMVDATNHTITTGADWALVGNYSPPASCSAPWSAIVAELSASIGAGLEKRIAAVWIGGVEILRSSTVKTVGHGAFWKVKKDVSRYASVLSKSNVTAAFVVRDVAKDTVNGTYQANFTGSFNVNVTFYFYGGKVSSVENGMKIRKFGFGGLGVSEKERKLVSLSEKMKVKEEEEEVGEMGFQSEEKASGESEENVKSESFLKLPSEGSDGKAENQLQYKHFYQTPADLIIPISKGGNSTGSWFVIQNGSDLHSKEIKIPNNTYKAVLEIYVSAHASDEFWYSNPPNTYLQNSSLTEAPVKNAFRQVFATIDGLYVGSFVPFPIVYSGGIDPLFWDPIVAIGAFCLPSDDLDLTPFLGLLLDNKSHTFTLGVTDATFFWLVDANLHLWLDHNSSHVTAGLIRYTAPEIEITRKNRFGSSESKFKIQAKRKLKFQGWVMSSQGNLTTKIEHEFEYENEIKTKAESGFKEVQLKSKTKTETEVHSAFPRSLVAEGSYETEYPLELKIERERKGDSSYLTKIEFSHEKEEKGKVELPSGSFSTSLKNRQESESRTLVQGQAVLSSGANTEQKYKFRDQNGCYIRNVVAGAGYLLEDSSSNVCLQ
ncbi:hypothetical protein AAC387_Pa11g0906 [Persea americana]